MSGASRRTISTGIRAVLLTLVTAAPLVTLPAGEDRPGWVTGLGLAVVVAAAGLSRARPVGTALGVLAASAIDWRLLVAVLLLSYLAGRRRPLGTATWCGFSGVLAGGIGVQVLMQTSDVYASLVWAAGAIAFGLFPALAGAFRRLRAELVRAGWDRAAHLEREQRIVAEQARLRERARIARDMHDSLGHELGLIALRAGALELAADLAPRHREAASQLRAGVTTAAERLAEIIGVLRDETDEAPLRPVDEHIEDLVGRAAASGVPVTLEVASEVGDVAVMQYRAAYRVVQESLTNATRHAGGAPVRVRVGRDADEMTVAVRNEPVGRVAAAQTAGGGRGLTGLRERIGLAGGVLSAGPLPDGGFEVTARLPVHAGTTVAPAGDRPGESRRGPGDGGLAVPPRGWETDAPGAAAPGAATGFRRARGRARRGLAVAVTVPPLLVTVPAATLMVVYARDSHTSRLSPERYAGLRIGVNRADVAGWLPERQVPERRDEAGPARPPGSACEYYRSVAGFVPRPFDVYRLCFRDGVLVAKDALPPAG